MLNIHKRKKFWPEKKMELTLFRRKIWKKKKKKWKRKNGRRSKE